MLKIFLVRHGETEWNQSFRYQGWSDIPLNEVGKQQAQLVAQRLKIEKFDAVYSSDLLRSMQTAQEIAANQQLSIYSVPALREFNYGVWEGLTLSEINAQFPGQRDKWLNNPEENRVPGGESFGEVRSRAMQWLGQLLLEQPRGQVAVVTHGGVIALLLVTLMHKDIQELRLFFTPNTGVSLIEVKETLTAAQVCYWGDVEHLAPLEGKI